MNESVLRTLVKEEVENILKEDKIRDKLAEKAKTKADGIYSVDGVIYRVKNKTLTHYTKRGEILVVYGYVDTPVGSFQTSSEARKLLKNI